MIASVGMCCLSILYPALATFNLEDCHSEHRKDCRSKHLTRHKLQFIVSHIRYSSVQFPVPRTPVFPKRLDSGVGQRRAGQRVSFRACCHACVGRAPVRNRSLHVPGPPGSHGSGAAGRRGEYGVERRPETHRAAPRRAVCLGTWLVRDVFGWLVVRDVRSDRGRIVGGVPERAERCVTLFASEYTVPR